MSRFGWSKYRRATGVWASAPKQPRQVPLPHFDDTTGLAARLWAVVDLCKDAIQFRWLPLENFHSSLLHLHTLIPQHPISPCPRCTSRSSCLT